MVLQSINVPDYIKFFIGGCSGILTIMIVQPLDFVKTRMQITGQDGIRKSYKNSCDAIHQITKNEGILAIYSGLTAALFRQATYTTAKLGIYSMLYEKYSIGIKQPSFLLKLILGFIAGTVASCIGTPSEIVLIRMTADGILPIEQRRNYRNVFHALLCIVRDEGFLGLWKSLLPTISRGAVVSLVQLASYSQAKQIMMEKYNMKDDIFVHFMSSAMSGLVTAIISMPVDMIKTRIQNMRVINGIPEYSSCWNVFHRLIENEGIRSLWKGFVPYFLKIGSNTILMFIFFEQLTIAYKTFFLNL